METITFDDIEFTKQNPWNGRTMHLVIWLRGGGNMFGGSGEGVTVIVHGETKRVAITGFYTKSHNIYRGANADDSGTTSYYKGATCREDIVNRAPTWRVNVDGRCTSGADLVAVVETGVYKAYLKR